MYKQDEQEVRVLKHAFPSRLFHWGLVLGFLPAALTGVLIWLKPGSADFGSLVMRIHIIGAFIFTLSGIVFTVTAFDRFVAFVRMIGTWSRHDLEWLKVGGGYLHKIFLGRDIAVPPMDKMNSGQKLMGLVMLFGGTALLVSGWILYAFIPLVPKAVIYWLDFGHLWGGLLMVGAVLSHMVLGIYNWGEFKAMFGDGTQSLAEVRHHNPLWVAGKLELTKSGEAYVAEPQPETDMP